MASETGDKDSTYVHVPSLQSDPLAFSYRPLGQHAASNGAHEEKAVRTGHWAIGHLGYSSASSLNAGVTVGLSWTSLGLSSRTRSELLTGESMNWLQGEVCKTF